MTFPEYLERKYLNWQNRLGKRKTIDEFARLLGVSRPSITMWMNGSRKPGLENIRLLSAIFGLEIYDILGYPRPNPLYAYAERNWKYIPIKEQKKIAEIVSKFTAEPIPNEKHTARSR